MSGPLETPSRPLETEFYEPVCRAHLLFENGNISRTYCIFTLITAASVYLGKGCASGLRPIIVHSESSICSICSENREQSCKFLPMVSNYPHTLPLPREVSSLGLIASVDERSALLLSLSCMSQLEAGASNNAAHKPDASLFQGTAIAEPQTQCYAAQPFSFLHILLRVEMDAALPPYSGNAASQRPTFQFQATETGQWKFTSR
jgi:hypothetical protein